jgi:hypothetical protein
MSSFHRPRQSFVLPGRLSMGLATERSDYHGTNNLALPQRH